MAGLRIRTNAKAIAAAFKAVSTEVTMIQKEALREAGIWGHREIVRNIARKAKKQGTGTLHRGVSFKVTTVKGGSMKLELGFLKTKGGKPVPIYAAQANFGGTIVPKTAKMLAWQDRETGEWIFAKKVVQKGLHFLEPVFKEMPKRVVAELDLAAATKIQQRFDKLVGKSGGK